MLHSLRLFRQNAQPRPSPLQCNLVPLHSSLSTELTRASSEELTRASSSDELTRTSSSDELTRASGLPVPTFFTERLEKASVAGKHGIFVVVILDVGGGPSGGCSTGIVGVLGRSVVASEVVRSPSSFACTTAVGGQTGACCCVTLQLLPSETACRH
ncbi:hypothetical protein Vadar_016248 [Vaccinium darrowii]|uniref:Uncharacterized protein n=1 Tax=Vaccinium darrowii TaxID=229202 RepID=A0ACB7YWA2_9ERIC|nr:hypothetical protein Vadar_016248 [Vaccinium darrowii]